MRRSQRVALPALLLLLTVLALRTMPGGLAHANGVPTRVDLSYIDLSNWGPTDATGTAELLFADGRVRLLIEGLPELTDQRYQGWLVNSEVGDAISVGRFNADASDQIIHEGVLPPIADFGFDLFIITVEPEPDGAPQPSEDRSIGGYFSLIGQAGDTGQGTDDQGAINAPGDGNAGGAGEASDDAAVNAPGELPATGDFTLESDLVRVGLLFAVMALAVFVGLRLGRRAA